jgi:phage-related protein (TIGR01555 family)
LTLSRKQLDARKKTRAEKRKAAPKLVSDNVTPMPRGKITPEVVAKSKLSQRRKVFPDPSRGPFVIPLPPKGVVPNDAKMAMDDAIGTSFDWAISAYSAGMFTEGLYFLGYPYLAELAQRPEYRRISEIIAQEMTRKWIKVTSKGDEDKTEKIAELVEALENFKVQDTFRRCAEQDGLFGRAHLFIDIGKSDDPAELKTPIGNGRDATSKGKITKGSLNRIATVEALWCYPSLVNSNNPLKADWYNPQSWYVNSQEVHASRLLLFVGREVPDILKPAYSFGGLSMSQMAKPYVDIWIRNRQSVSDLIHSFSAMVLSTDMTSQLQGDGQGLFARASLFNNMRDNSGILLLNKDTEEFANVSTPLGTLDQLLAQSQEHMCSVAGVPVVKLLGVQPAGLNASSQGEIDTFSDSIKAYQEKLFGDKLRRVIDIVQLHLWGDVDSDITYNFVPLEEMSEKELADIRKTEAETDDLHINAGVISTLEVRKRIANDANSPYINLDAEDLPEPPDVMLGSGELNPGEPKQLTDQSDKNDDDDNAEDSIFVAHDEASFVESKHPRGQPNNAGQFGPGGGGGSGKKHAAVEKELSKKVGISGNYRKGLQNILKAGGLSKEHETAIKQNILKSYVAKKEQVTKSGDLSKAASIQKKISMLGKQLGIAQAEQAPAPKPASTVSPQDVEKAKNKNPMPNPHSLKAIAEFNQKYSGANTPTTQAGLEEKVKAFKNVGVAVGQELAEKQKKDQAELAAKTAKAMADLSPEDKKHYEVLQNIMSGSATAAIQTAGYRLKSAGLVNKQMRNGAMSQEQWGYAKALNKALSKLPPYSGTTKRGTNIPASELAKYTPGMVIEERAFTSTGVGKKFSGEVTYEISGHSGRDIKKLSSHEGENEVLFRSGSRFKVISVTGKHIKMEEVDYD